MKKNRGYGYRNLITFMLIIIIGYLAIVGIDDIFQAMNNKLDERLENGETRITIGQNILRHIDTLEADFYLIALNKNRYYAESIKRDMEIQVEHLNQSFNTLEKGGEIVHNIRLNIVGKNWYREVIKYTPLPDSPYSLETMDLSSKLQETIEKMDQLIILMDKYEKNIKSSSNEGIIRLEKEIYDFMKLIPPHFAEMKENANRLIYESRIKVDEQKLSINEKKRWFSLLQIAGSIIIFIIIIGFGYISAKQLINLNMKLSKLAYDAEKATIAKSLFVANMSHEIRTPLNAVIGFSEILESSVLPEAEKEYVNIISKSAKSLLDIVNDILDLTKIESNNVNLENVSFSPSIIFEEVVELYTLRAKEKSIKLDYYMDDKVPKYIFGDPVRLKQIVVNLLSNAIKFTSEKGTVSLSITVMFILEGKVWLKFEVQDNGIGISNEQQQYIFNPFEQAEAGTTRKYGGTGLGLAISNQLVHAMGSELKVDSEEGEGSLFQFEIEFTIDTESNKLDPKNLYNMVYGVCCVDSYTPNIRERVVKYLEEYGTIVTDFLSVQYERIDIIFVFLNDDMERRLGKLEERYPDVPVIFVGDISRLRPAEKIFINEVINEPIYGAKLLKVISRYYKELRLSNNNIDKPIMFTGDVIVAEDNQLNQKLIDILLRKFGIKAFFANNGEDVVDLYKQLKPDLILMDIHMHVLDGVEATKQIKQLEEKNGYGEVTIIALTADVLEEDLCEFRAIGMKDFLSKPIDIKRMQKILSKYLSIEKIIDGDKCNCCTNEMINEEIRFEYSVNKVAKEMCLDIVTLQFLIEDFFMQLPQQLTEIERILTQKDAKSLIFALHTLKGATANMHFMDIVARIKMMEIDAKKGQFESIDIMSLKALYQCRKKEIDKQIV